MRRLAGGLAVGAGGGELQIERLARDDDRLAGLGRDAEAEPRQRDGLGGRHVIAVERSGEGERRAGAHPGGVEGQLGLALGVGGDGLAAAVGQRAAHRAVGQRLAPVEGGLQAGLDRFAPEPDAARELHRQLDLLQLERADLERALEMQRLQPPAILMRRR